MTESYIKIIAISFSITLLFAILLVLLLKLYNKYFKGTGENAMILGKIDTSLYTVIPSVELLKPFDGFNYSLVFSINIQKKDKN